jgi:hypothetical protein
MSTPTYIEQSEVYNVQQNMDARNPFRVEAKGNTSCMQYIGQLYSVNLEKTCFIPKFSTHIRRY